MKEFEETCLKSKGVGKQFGFYSGATNKPEFQLDSKKIQALNSDINNQFDDSWWHNTLVHDDSSYNHRLMSVDHKLGNYFINYQMYLVLKSRNDKTA